MKKWFTYTRTPTISTVILTNLADQKIQRSKDPETKRSKVQEIELFTSLSLLSRQDLKRNRHSGCPFSFCLMLENQQKIIPVGHFVVPNKSAGFAFCHANADCFEAVRHTDRTSEYCWSLFGLYSCFHPIKDNSREASRQFFYVCDMISLHYRGTKYT